MRGKSVPNVFILINFSMTSIFNICLVYILYIQYIQYVSYMLRREFSQIAYDNLDLDFLSNGDT